MKITIGKFTLETLTSGMYERPIDLYREYIQNAVDSIDVAISCKLLKSENGQIDISINKEDRIITITDNGTGIPTDKAIQYLLDIGHSPKRFTSARGFRGIGRLAALAYCDSLAFVTSEVGEEKSTTVVFDAKKLRERMSNQFVESDLLSLINEMVKIKVEQEVQSKHYFKVEMTGVDDIDDILDANKVYEYLEQVAPVNYDNNFKWGRVIISKLRCYGYELSKYRIFIRDGTSVAPIFKAYSDAFISDRLRHLNDLFYDVETREFTYNGEVIAYLWYAKTNFHGTIQNEAIKGIRMRKGNILIGDKRTLNHIFKDERFNGWLLGELHIISEQIIPNARRDEFEKNAIYTALIDDLRSWADEISAEIRKISIQRSLDRKAQRIIEISQNGTTSNNEAVSTVVIPEISLILKDETEQLNHYELVSALDRLIGLQSSNTKYKALSLQSHITYEQKKILERVFDIISNIDDNQQTNYLITKILREFTPKAVRFPEFN